MDFLGEIVVVHVVSALWREFAERNWRDIEEFTSFRAHNLRHSSLNQVISNNLHHRHSNNSNRARTLGIRVEQNM
jgi:hypothetical protein